MNSRSSCEQASQRRLTHREHCHEKSIKKLEGREDKKEIFCRQLYRQRQPVPDERHAGIGKNLNIFTETESESGIAKKPSKIKYLKTDLTGDTDTAGRRASIDRNISLKKTKFRDKDTWQKGAEILS